jgi:hypothetical protein
LCPVRVVEHGAYQRRCADRRDRRFHIGDGLGVVGRSRIERPLPPHGEVRRVGGEPRVERDMQARDGLVLSDRGIPCRLPHVHLQRGDVDADAVGDGEWDQQRREDQRRSQQQPTRAPARSPVTDRRLQQERVHRQHDERHAPHARDRRQAQDRPVVDLRNAE